MSKSKKHYTEEFKLTVLKDKYANNLSIYSAAKKYGIRSSTCICAWEKKYPVDSILLSLSKKSFWVGSEMICFYLFHESFKIRLQMIRLQMIK